jgi:hypothetical protein
MELTLKRFATLAALGALGVSAGALGLFLLVAFGSRSTALGGIDSTQAVVTWISVAVPIVLVVAAHLVFARILFRYANEQTGDGTRETGGRTVGRQET